MSNTQRKLLKWTTTLALRITDLSGMKANKPRLVAINHDDHHAKHVGSTSNGLQFFLTTPFQPATSRSEGCEYIALFKFDLSGNLVDSIIESLGARGCYDNDAKKNKCLALLNTLGDVNYRRITVKPFSIKHHGVEIGLITRKGKDETWAVELLPGNYMAFFEPWDSGEYDT